VYLTAFANVIIVSNRETAQNIFCVGLKPGVPRGAGLLPLAWAGKNNHNAIIFMREGWNNRWKKILNAEIPKCIKGENAMPIEFSPEERLMYLIIMAGQGNQTLYELYSQADDVEKSRILDAMAKGMEALEPIMDMYGLARDPEGVARAMVMTEDLIGCEPKGKLLSVSPDQAIRRVDSCPWADSYSNDGGTCRLVMAAMEQGLGRKYGLTVTCEQTMAEGADHCIWKVEATPK
jgi:hypothetical protein